VGIEVAKKRPKKRGVLLPHTRFPKKRGRGDTGGQNFWINQNRGKKKGPRRGQ